MTTRDRLDSRVKVVCVLIGCRLLVDTGAHAVPTGACCREDGTCEDRIAPNSCNCPATYDVQAPSESGRSCDLYLGDDTTCAVDGATCMSACCHTPLIDVGVGYTSVESPACIELPPQLCRSFCQFSPNSAWRPFSGDPLVLLACTSALAKSGERCLCDKSGDACVSSGACCDLLTGECTDGVSLKECIGEFLGSTTTCASTTCQVEPAGACCTESGACVDSVRPEDCTCTGGLDCALNPACSCDSFQGVGSRCRDTWCTGACRVSGDSLESLIFPFGELAGIHECVNDVPVHLCANDADVDVCVAPVFEDISAWLPRCDSFSGMLCSEVNTGACCDTTLRQCVDDVPASQCDGLFKGFDTTCADVACQAICCSADGSCSLSSADECQCHPDAYGCTRHVLRLDSIAPYCDATWCPNSACCTSDGQCIDGLTPSECAAQGRDCVGRFVECTAESCVGACCLPDDNCLNAVTQAQCEENVGNYRGHGTSCGSAPCIGACCLPDRTCRVMPESSCVGDTQGVYQGDGSNCEDGTCPFLACGAGGGCCQTHLRGGCVDKSCCERVCEANPSCCLGEVWSNHPEQPDTGCIALAESLCGESGSYCSGVGACCFGDHGCADDVSLGSCRQNGGTYQGSGSRCYAGVFDIIAGDCICAEGCRSSSDVSYDGVVARDDMDLIAYAMQGPGFLSPVLLSLGSSLVPDPDHDGDFDLRDFAVAQSAYTGYLVADTTVSIALAATITGVDDPTGLLGSAISSGTPAHGQIMFNVDTPDSDPTLDASVFQHVARPYGLFFGVGSLIIHSHPFEPTLVIETKNNSGSPPMDSLSFRSLHNLSYPEDLVVTEIRWELVDPTATALSSDELPARLPSLGDWSVDSGVVIHGAAGGSPEQAFTIWAQVTSAGCIHDERSTGCVPICGDAVCDLAESCRSCPVDCAMCDGTGVVAATLAAGGGLLDDGSAVAVGQVIVGGASGGSTRLMQGAVPCWQAR